MFLCNKMLLEDVILSVLLFYFYLFGDVGNFRLKRICDYEKEFESEIDCYK